MTVDQEILHPKVAKTMEQFGIVGEVVECDANLADTAAFCEHYGYSQDQSANCIIIAGKADPTKYACCVVLATYKLDVNRSVIKLLGVKKASFATADQTKAETDMEIGGVTPIGIEHIPIYIDAAVMSREVAIIGGGNRTSKLLIKPSEFLKLPNALVVEGLAVPR